MIVTTSYPNLLKCAICFLTLHGLFPFTYERNESFVRSTKKLYIYSLIVTFVLSIFFIFGSIYVGYNYYLQGFDFIVFAIAIFEIFFFVMKAVALFLLHNIHYIKIMKLVNNVLEINKLVFKFAQPTTTFNHRMKNILKIEFFLVVLQMFCVMFTLITGDFLTWIIISYPLVVTMLVTTIYIFGGIFINLNFIRIINEKLKFNNENCAAIISEDIESASILLSNIQKSTTNLNKLYGVQISLTLVGSLILMFCSVKFFNFLLHSIDLYRKL